MYDHNIGGRVWNILDHSNERMVTLYFQVMKQRKLQSIQLSEEYQQQTTIDRIMKAQEQLRVVFLVINILLSWLSLPYLGVLQVLVLFSYYQNIIRSFTIALIPVLLIALILLIDVLLNFIAWLASQWSIESNILTHQWENMGYTFVKFTYEQLYQERKRSFFYMLSVVLLFICFFIFVGLQIDNFIKWSWIFIFLPLWIVFLIVFQSVPVKQWSQSANIVYYVIFFLFGIPSFLFTILLVIKLQFYHDLRLFVVFLPLWVMDFFLTVLVLGPTIVEFIRQSVMRNIRGIMDTLDLLCFYAFIVFPKILMESVFCCKEYFTKLPSSYSCIPLFVIMVYICVITTSVCVDSFTYHHRVFSFYYAD